MNRHQVQFKGLLGDVLDTYKKTLIEPVVHGEYQSYDLLKKIKGWFPEDDQTDNDNFLGLKQVRSERDWQGYNAIKFGGKNLVDALCAEKFTREWAYCDQFRFISPSDFSPYPFRLVFCRGWVTRCGMGYHRKSPNEEGRYRQQIEGNARYWEQLYLLGKGEEPQGFIPTLLLLSEMTKTGHGFLHLTIPFKMNGSGTRIENLVKETFHQYVLETPMSLVNEIPDPQEEIIEIPLVAKF